MSNGHDDHKHAHPPYLAHHFDTPAQQFENGKLGMWIFLGTEILMFGGLFALYTLYRSNHPEVYLYAHKMLNWKLGALNTAILLASSYTMVLGVRAATLNQKGWLVFWLVLTFMGGIGFFTVKSVEYGTKFEHGLYPSKWNLYYPVDATRAHVSIPDPANRAALLSGGLNPAATDNLSTEENIKNAKPGEAPVPVTNKEYWDKKAHRTCRQVQLACIEHLEHEMGLVGHGEGHEGAHEAAHAAPVAGLEPKAEASEVAEAAPEASTPALVTGRPEGFGSNAQAHVVAPPAGTDGAQVKENADAAPTLAQQLGTPDIRTKHHELAYTQISPEEQGRVHIFFGIYYVMTGLHGLHVAIGMAIILWLIIKASKGHFSAEYNAPVDIGGLYWHLVDLIWIFLFPLLYLIH